MASKFRLRKTPESVILFIGSGGSPYSVVLCGNLTIPNYEKNFHCFLFIKKVKLRHSPGRPSRSDFVQSVFDKFKQHGIMRLGRKVNMFHADGEKPRAASLGFSMPFWRGDLILRLIAGWISIEPFADAVGNDASRNRDQKGKYIFHAFTSLPV